MNLKIITTKKKRNYKANKNYLKNSMQYFNRKSGRRIFVYLEQYS